MVHSEIERWLCLCQSMIFFIWLKIYRRAQNGDSTEHTRELNWIGDCHLRSRYVVNFSWIFSFFSMLCLINIDAAWGRRLANVKGVLCKANGERTWSNVGVCVSLRSTNNTRHNLHSINLISFFPIFARIAELRCKILCFWFQSRCSFSSNCVNGTKSLRFAARVFGEPYFYTRHKCGIV